MSSETVSVLNPLLSLDVFLPSLRLDCHVILLFQRMAALKGKAFLKDTEAWQKLQNYFDQNKDNINILDLFNKDPERFSKFSCKVETPNEGPLLVDYSKNRVNNEVMELLLNLGKLSKM